MKYISGDILTKEKILKGYISIKGKNIVDIIKGNPPKKPLCKGLIVPTFVNSHTHIGDSFIFDKKIDLPKDIESLVAPPNGLKHRLLKKASEVEIIKGMEKSIELMIKNGVELFCDFRENGLLGICQLKSALYMKHISSVILSRPDILDYNNKEINLLLKNSNGIAISSISDWDYSLLEKISSETIKKNKIFALHASERIRENIDDILDLKPNFLVHMIKATETDLQKVKENNIPIVICPKSNSFYCLKPNFKLLKKIGNTILVGTDNAMINPPNILEEIKYIKKISNIFSTNELINMITYGARKALNHDCNILCPNSKASFVVLDKKFLKPLYVSVAK